MGTKKCFYYFIKDNSYRVHGSINYNFLSKTAFFEFLKLIRLSSFQISWNHFSDHWVRFDGIRKAPCQKKNYSDKNFLTQIFALIYSWKYRITKKFFLIFDHLQWVELKRAFYWFKALTKKFFRFLKIWFLTNFKVQ